MHPADQDSFHQVQHVYHAHLEALPHLELQRAFNVQAEAIQMSQIHLHAFSVRLEPFEVPRELRWFRSVSIAKWVSMELELGKVAATFVQLEHSTISRGSQWF